MITKLSAAHKKTFDAILGHPAPHNLAWHDVKSLLEVVAVVEPEHSGKTKVSGNGKTLFLHADGHKDVHSAEQLKHIRDFLKGLQESGDTAGANPSASAPHLLVVIDHREARIFQTELHGTVPQRILPHHLPHNGAVSAGDSGRYLHDVGNEGTGQRRPELKSFYEAVAAHLKGAAAVLVFGCGTGASSAAESLMADLKAHHKDLAAKVVGVVSVDEKHLTEDQMLARARKFYAELPATAGA